MELATGRSERRQIVSAGVRALGAHSLGLIAITLMVKLASFVEKQVLAYFFGTGSTVEVYLVASTAALAVFLLVRELVEPALLPMFVERATRGEHVRAFRLFITTFVGVAVATLVVAFGTVCFADSLAAQLAPGFDAPALAATATTLQIMALGLVFSAASTVTYIVLNGLSRFALPAAGDVAQRLVAIAACALAAWSGDTTLWLALGIALAPVARLAVHVPGLWPHRAELARAGLAERADRTQLFAMMAPLIVGSLLAQISELADNMFTSVLDQGAVAARVYARKLVDLPVVLLPYSLSVVAFPYLAALVARGDRSGLVAFVAKGTRVLVLSFTPLATITFVLAEPLVSLVFERGQFDAEARELTASALRAYSLGLVTFAIETLLVPAFYALKDTRTPVIAGIGGVLVNLGLTALWVEPYGVAGVAVALVVSKTLKSMVLGALLFRRSAELRALGIALTAAVLGAIGGSAVLTVWPEPDLAHASVLDKLSMLWAAAAAFGASGLCTRVFAPADYRMIAAGTRDLLLSLAAR